MRDHLGNFMVSADLQFARGVILLDDMSNDSAWEAAGTGADFSVAKDASAAFVGAYGLLVKTRVTDPAENDVVTAQRYGEYPESGLLVVRAMVGLPDASLLKQVRMFVFADSGAAQVSGTVKWVQATGQVAYGDAGSVYQDVTGMVLPWYDLFWWRWELVVDVRAAAYREVAICGYRADLGGIGMVSGATAGWRGTYFGFELMAAGAAQAVAYLDSLYVGEFLHV